MKIIDLLNKIANGEEPPRKIKYNNEMYHLNDFKTNYFDDIDCSFIDFKNMHDEVEIIEEKKKIYKLDQYDFSGDDLALVSKINELIDKLEELDGKIK